MSYSKALLLVAAADYAKKNCGHNIFCISSTAVIKIE
jgi:hypothetical protein